MTDNNDNWPTWSGSISLGDFGERLLGPIAWSDFICDHIARELTNWDLPSPLSSRNLDRIRFLREHYEAFEEEARRVLTRLRSNAPSSIEFEMPSSSQDMTLKVRGTKDGAIPVCGAGDDGRICPFEHSMSDLATNRLMLVYRYDFLIPKGTEFNMVQRSAEHHAVKTSVDQEIKKRVEAMFGGARATIEVARQRHGSATEELRRRGRDAVASGRYRLVGIRGDDANSEVPALQASNLEFDWMGNRITLAGRVWETVMVVCVELQPEREKWTKPEPSAEPRPPAPDVAPALGLGHEQSAAEASFKGIQAEVARPDYGLGYGSLYTYRRQELGQALARLQVHEAKSAPSSFTLPQFARWVASRSFRLWLCSFGDIDIADVGRASVYTGELARRYLEVERRRETVMRRGDLILSHRLVPKMIARISSGEYKVLGLDPTAKEVEISVRQLPLVTFDLLTNTIRATDGTTLWRQVIVVPVVPQAGPASTVSGGGVVLQLEEQSSPRVTSPSPSVADPAQPAKKPKPSLDQVMTWYETYVASRPAGALPPTREEDLTAANQHFRARGLKELVRKARAKKAPAFWKEPGAKGRKILSRQK